MNALQFDATSGLILRAVLVYTECEYKDVPDIPELAVCLESCQYAEFNPSESIKELRS